MRHALTLSAAAACFAMAAPASAAIIIYDSAGPVQPDENVLFPTNEVGTTVTGTTNQSGTSVTFSSTTDTLSTTSSQGQARIEATDGSLDQVTFGLTDPLLAFTEAEFNLFNALQGTTQVTITLSSGLVQTFALNANGQNFFGIRATDGDSLTSVSFDTNGSGVTDLRQVRIGGIGAPVPEPGTWAMMLFGFGAVGFAMRRRRKIAGPRVRFSYS